MLLEVHKAAENDAAELLIDQILAAGRRLIRLDCPAANEKLCACYELQGFQRVSIDPTGKAFYQRTV